MSTTSFNPRTGAARGTALPDTTEAEHDAIAAAAASAALSWASTPRAQRATALDRIASGLDDARDALVALADAETGLGAVRLGGEVTRTTGQLRMFADLIRDDAYLHAGLSPTPRATLAPGTPDLRRHLVPVGPVAVFAASNFPFAFSVPGGDTASALAAGCPVIVKIHPAHPELSVRVAELVQRALDDVEAPPGVFAIVSGVSEGLRLVQDPVVRAAAFTGSLAGGLVLAEGARNRPMPIPFYGELGSVNPVFVLPEAVGDAAQFVEAYLDSLTMGSGQFCTNPSLLIAPRSAGLADAIAKAVATRPAGVVLHEGIRDGFDAAVSQLTATPGLHGLASDAEIPGEGFFVRPIVFTMTADTALANGSVVRDEYFGPAGILVEYDDGDDLLAVARILDGCLVSTIHADGDTPLLRDLLSEATRLSGRVVWNAWPTGVAVTAGQHHGGPFPSTTNPLFTSVGPDAISRFLRPVAFQGVPEALVPDEARG